MVCWMKEPNTANKIHNYTSEQETRILQCSTSPQINTNTRNDHTSNVQRLTGNIGTRIHPVSSLASDSINLLVTEFFSNFSTPCI